MSRFSGLPADERFAIDRLGKVAPDAVRAAYDAVIALPVKPGTWGTTNRQDKLRVLADLNAALAVAGLPPVTYSMLEGWSITVRAGRAKRP